MLRHEEFLSAFHGALTGGTPATGMLICPAGEAERRFAVYRNNMVHSLTQALAARFPVICRLVGGEFFNSLARLYIHSNGPNTPILAEWGAEFAPFLSGFPPLASYPYMADVARIEYARGRAFHAADSVAADPAWLSGLDPLSARLGIHSSVSVLHLQHPAVSIWARNQPEGGSVTLSEEPEIALILRDRSYAVPVCAIRPGDAALIEALQHGECLGEAALRALAAQPDHDPSGILVHLMRQGAIINPEAHPCAARSQA